MNLSPAAQRVPGERASVENVASDSKFIAPRAAARAAWILIALRAGYAYNWFDIGPTFLSIGSTFSVGPAAWGLLVAAFLVGAGALQVPAGFFARRYGARRVSLVGAALLAGAALASALAPSYLWLFVTRLVAGAGAGLFFSPAIGLVATLFPPGRRGLPVGGFSSAFSGGAAVGLVATAVLIPAIGWRWSLGLGGVALAALTVIGLAMIPASAGAPSPVASRTRTTGGLPSALGFRGVWAVGFAFIGFEGATFATSQFIVPFAENVRLWSATVAGVVGMMFVLPSVVGGPLGGTVAERRMDHRRQFVVVTVLGAVAVACLPLAGLAATVAIGAAFSFAYGFVYAVMYVIPHFWRAVPAEEIPLAIGLFNGIQLAGGALVAYVFGWVVAARSYSVAWELLAVLQVGTLVALFLLPATVAREEARRPAAGDIAPP